MSDVTGEHALQVELLTELEQVIERGLTTFIDVGKALVVIQEQRLYRTIGYVTFEAYCQERWGWSRKRAYRLITAAEAVSTLVDENHEVPLENTMTKRQVSPQGDTSEGLKSVTPASPFPFMPRHEREARELARVKDVGERRVLWGELVEEHGESITTAQVREAVDAHLDRNREVQERRQRQGKAVADFIQNTESWKQSTLAIDCFRALSRSREELLKFDPATVIPLFDDMERRIVEGMLSDMLAWLQAAQRELRGSLRLVGKD